MNPLLGLLYHWIGGFASASFYLPYRKVRGWSWETYWLVGGTVSWLLAPMILALLLTNNLWGVLRSQDSQTLLWAWVFGALWGFGNLTFGMSVRYLGMSLGMGIALGYCAAFGTLVPPVAKLFFPAVSAPENIVQIASVPAGQVTLFGVFVCLAGIAVAAMAGLAKERELPEAEKKKAIKEFNFPRGIAVATCSGILSACFSFGITAANPIAEASHAAGTATLWTGLPKLVVVLWGGLTTNALWCIALNFINRSGGEYLGKTRDPAAGRPPQLANYLFSAAAGLTWYLQFFFYTMGETQMGKYGFASWTLHMASIIIFSTMWGWMLHEWKGTSRKAHLLIALGVLLLVLSTVIVGYGTYLSSATPAH